MNIEVTARGIRFNVVRLGPGAQRDLDPYTDSRRAVVFLHGLIVDNLSSFYYTLAPGVARTTDTILFDLRGHGRSERPLSGYRIEDGVDDLFGILDALSIDDPVHLVGNSYGGTLALAAALLRPDRVAGLALIEAHPALAGWADELIEDLTDLVSGFESDSARDYFDNGPRNVRVMAQTCKELFMASSMRTDLQASQPITPERLASVSCPTLLLYGENSDIIDRAYLLKDAIPGSVLSVFEGCSHLLLIENPREVGRQVQAWLDEQAKQASLAAGTSDLGNATR